MHKIVESWIYGIFNKMSPILDSEIKVVGVRERYPMERASATLIVKPSNIFAVEIENEEILSDEEVKFANFFVFGVLDVIISSDLVKISRVSICISCLVIDPVISSPISFRHAGRDAGEKFIRSVGESRKNGAIIFYD